MPWNPGVTWLLENGDLPAFRLGRLLLSLAPNTQPTTTISHQYTYNTTPPTPNARLFYETIERDSTICGLLTGVCYFLFKKTDDHWGCEEQGH